MCRNSRARREGLLWLEPIRVRQKASILLERAQSLKLKAKSQSPAFSFELSAFGSTSVMIERQHRIRGHAGLKRLVAVLQLDLDAIDQLDPLVLGLNVLRRELRFIRNEAHFAGERFLRKRIDR